jgi:hypothetical protein
MPKKSGQDRRRKLSRSKRKELRSLGTVQQQAVAQTTVAVASPAPTLKVPISPAASTSKKTQTAIEHRFVVGELKRIGILAGIIMVVLVVLAVALS